MSDDDCDDMLNSHMSHLDPDDKGFNSCLKPSVEYRLKDRVKNRVSDLDLFE